MNCKQSFRTRARRSTECAAEKESAEWPGMVLEKDKESSSTLAKKDTHTTQEQFFVETQQEENKFGEK